MLLVSRPDPRALRIGLGLALVWLLFVEFLAPRLIISIYQDNLLDVVPLVRQGKTEKDLDYVLESWPRTGYGVLIAVVMFVGFTTATKRPIFVRRQVGRALPAELGAIRMIVGSILLLSALWEDLPSTASLPRQMFEPRGLVPIPEVFLTSEQTLLGFQVLTIVLLAMATLGLATRVSVPSAAVAYLILGSVLRQYSRFYHTGLVPWYLLALLAFTPCADGWSIDRLLRIVRGQPVAAGDNPAPVYAWSRYLCWAAMATCYVTAGLSKLRTGGLSWFDADSLRSILITDTLNPMEFDFKLSLDLITAPNSVLVTLAFVAVLLEISYGLVLFSRLARRIIPLVTAGFHVCVLLLQNVLFFDMILLQLIFLDLKPIRRAERGLEKWVRAQKQVRVEPVSTLSQPPRLRYWRAATCGVVGLLLFCWALRVEAYPLTAMQMYAQVNPNSWTDYFEIKSYHRSGRWRRAPLETAIGAVADSRYRRLISLSFESERYHAIAEQFLQACGTLYNERLETKDPIVSFRVDLRRYDLGLRPNAPKQGRLVDHWVWTLADGTEPRP